MTVWSNGAHQKHMSLNHDKAWLCNQANEAHHLFWEHRSVRLLIHAKGLAGELH